MPTKMRYVFSMTLLRSASVFKSFLISAFFLAVVGADFALVDVVDLLLGSAAVPSCDVLAFFFGAGPEPTDDVEDGAFFLEPVVVTEAAPLFFGEGGAFGLEEVSFLVAVAAAGVFFATVGAGFLVPGFGPGFFRTPPSFLADDAAFFFFNFDGSTSFSGSYCSRVSSVSSTSRFPTLTKNSLSSTSSIFVVVELANTCSATSRCRSVSSKKLDSE
mmetsp:Transcript_13604/g.30902  ORF Transcript_13604/g.30902 Transcript_13604/m.30902 type:complete len:216 (-) Transcript_13604:119-766(-)